jgi:hypothetical protein
MKSPILAIMHLLISKKVSIFLLVNQSKLQAVQVLRDKFLVPLELLLLGLLLLMETTIVCLIDLLSHQHKSNQIGMLLVVLE